MDHILVAKNVTKTYGDYTALSNISLQIPENCIYGLLGPNGAGKTSFIRIINQITHQDEGEIWLNGEPLAPKHIASIGYLPEERGLYKSMKVGEQVLYLAQLKGLSKSEAKTRLKYWFDRLNIGDWWDKKIQELSKGMAQKIQFIVTVLHEPKLLIFDEPFSGFDPINANMIKDEILQLKKTVPPSSFPPTVWSRWKNFVSTLPLSISPKRYWTENCRTSKKRTRTTFLMWVCKWKRKLRF